MLQLLISDKYIQAAAGENVLIYRRQVLFTFQQLFIYKETRYMLQLMFAEVHIYLSRQQQAKTVADEYL